MKIGNPGCNCCRHQGFLFSHPHNQSAIGGEDGTFPTKTWYTNHLTSKSSPPPPAQWYRHGQIFGVDRQRFYTLWTDDFVGNRPTGVAVGDFGTYDLRRVSDASFGNVDVIGNFGAVDLGVYTWYGDEIYGGHWNPVCNRYIATWRDTSSYTEHVSVVDVDNMELVVDVRYTDTNASQRVHFYSDNFGSEFQRQVLDDAGNMFSFGNLGRGITKNGVAWGHWGVATVPGSNSLSETVHGSPAFCILDQDETGAATRLLVYKKWIMTLFPDPLTYHEWWTLEESGLLTKYDGVIDQASGDGLQLVNPSSSTERVISMHRSWNGSIYVAYLDGSNSDEPQIAKFDSATKVLTHAGGGRSPLTPPGASYIKAFPFYVPQSAR